MQQITRRIRLVALALASFAALAIAPACSLNETTGENQFNLLSANQEVEMGLASKPEIVAEFGGEVTDPQLKAYVTDMGKRLAAATEGIGPGLPWSFTLLNSDVVNAFALPGGQVFVTRGLARRLTNEAQLAGVIGHEIGHATARHGGQRISKQLGAQIILQGLSAGTGSPELTSLGEQVAQLSLLSYSRDQEHQADSLGVRYMVRAKYNPIGQVQVMQLFADLSKQTGGSGNEWTSTHPDPANRVIRLREEIARSYAGTQRDPSLKVGEQEYRAKFLSRLAMLPPAPDDIANGGTARTRLAIGRVLANHGLWCGHCAMGQ